MMSDNIVDPKKINDSKKSESPEVTSQKPTNVEENSATSSDSQEQIVQVTSIANEREQTEEKVDNVDSNSETIPSADGKSLVTSQSIQAEIDEQQEKSAKELERRKILWRKARPTHDRTKKPFKFKLIDVKRITKVTKGGRRFRFFAAALAGDENGKVGIGFGKGNEVNSARIKAYAQAEKKMIQIPIVNGTIPHEVVGRFCSSHIFFKPAPAGTGIVIGGASRNVIALLGIKNIRGKSLGSNNKMNLIQATMKALQSLKTQAEWKALRFPKTSNE